MSEGGEASQTVSITRRPQVVGSSPRGGGGQSGGKLMKSRERGRAILKQVPRGSIWCEVIRVRDFEWQSVRETESHRPEGTKRG